MATDFKIDKDIPAPPRLKYPFDIMEVGDSFSLPSSEAIRVGNLARAWGKRHNANAKFMVRVGDDGARIWRIS
jgi:hypothetical protein